MILTTDKEGDPPVLWQWLHQRTKLPWSTDLRTLGSVKKDGTIAAVIGYNMWVGDSCFIHMAFDSPHSFSRELLREAFIYPFDTCSVSVIYGLTPITNEHVLGFNRKIGFREIQRTEHFVLQEYRKEECRWLNFGVKNGRKEQRTGSAELHGSGRSNSAKRE